MSIKVRWYDENKTVITNIYGKSFQIEDFYNAIEVSYELMDSVDWTVDVIQDARNLKRIPPGVFSILRHVERKSHPRRGEYIYVGMNTLANAVVNMARQMAPEAISRHHVVDTIEEADKLLVSIRAERDAEQ